MYMAGFLLIDKPTEMTSHDVVDRVRRLTGEQRVGHAGTLDPFATGLLIVGVGRGATREMRKLVGLDKTYEAVFVLGATSDTDDRDGHIQPAPIPLHMRRTANNLPSLLKQFIGEIEQIPPVYSAIKVGGKKMYEAARAGEPLKSKPRRVRVYSMVLSSAPTFHDSRFTIHVRIHCSSGTYIRSLARDLGRALGGGGYVQTLRRTAIGPFSIEHAHTLSELEALAPPKSLSDVLIPIPKILGALTSICE